MESNGKEDDDQSTLMDFYGNKAPVSNYSHLDDIDLEQFYKASKNNYLMILCKYRKDKCRTKWHEEVTMYGICQRFYPPKLDGHSVSSMRSLQIVLAYNKTDWTYGWNYMMDGFSIFYSPEGELVMDPMTSVTVNSRIVPVLLLQQHRNIKLGPPYTQCHNVTDDLKYFKNYTKKNCHYECLIDSIFEECKCGPPYFPRIEGIPMCNFSQHVNCVAKQLKDFDYANCTCLTQCSELYYQKTVYYTEIHQNFRNKTAKILKRFPDIVLASARISLPDPYVK